MKTNLPERLNHSLPFHYGWVIVPLGTLTVFCCLGLSRFGLGMLLPSMGQSLALSYSEMGLISTVNFIGYLVAVIAAPMMINGLGETRVVVLGLLIVAISMALVCQANQVFWISLFYTLTGFGSGTANIPMMVLIAHWFKQRYRGRAAGFVVIGSGFAIVFSGFLVPEINAQAGMEGWRYSWAVFAGISGLVAMLVAMLVRDRPSTLGLSAMGAGDETSAQAGRARETAIPARSAITRLGILYLLFGVSYMIFATFIVTTLVQERGFTEVAAGKIWAWIGGFSLLSGPVFGYLSDRFGRRVGLCTVFLVHTLAYTLVASHLANPSLYISIALFGIAAWAIPGIMAAAVADYVRPEKVATALSVVTLFFAVGQTLGPITAGMLADRNNSFDSSFALAAGLALLGALAALTLPGRTSGIK